jgi:predicted phage tail protein
MLSPQPAGLASKQSADNRVLCVGGVTNTAAQGYPVPLFMAAGG